MQKALMNDVLLQAVGESLLSPMREKIGQIIEVTRNPQNHYIEYIILESTGYDGQEKRFFSIPASSRFMSVSEAFNIMLQFPKDDIFYAKKVEAEQCPNPNLKFGNSIFELCNYQVPEKRGADYLVPEA
jgi:hypothetical protein